ncbi:Cd(II)/Pb(II)-responsive transcriptional regulator (plasmid) [Citrobacter freundii]|uniref:Cd(II)/Pb(II)-responsive transcriptional regulator n=1 Tax=Citrobacter TaxID=544 RepID=UPI0015E90ED1|nr:MULTISPECIES: Cd(II)/Pb(II)-responsive transcriptional regulator [Citrobacter]HCL6053592.1 Cd(II)/Pb(II)-responsive transcriptional regulator [Raoultella ornithinolytica]MBJ9840220.1 Cd(II)/Pb(II)-responsive transcriptional regulator [Citrobacter freundii]MCY3420023.1 Cd(II)/Pb(II)-responsive transcriptional regulator [Citrobacter freundii]MDE8815679.1 Cd(II)/Pb(II)-responsive transcriptional regulator [Citrobacter freundii]MDE8821701.1 Cd(II)/Pb(II)-responsive transcriptional regulator [Ci
MNVKIGELSKRTGCKIETIRYYEKEGLLPEPDRSQGNFRVYKESHFRRLTFILHCRALEMTLEEVKILLSYRESKTLNCDEVNALIDRHIHQIEIRVDMLLQLKHKLISLRKTCPGSRTSDSCGVLKKLIDDS